MKNYLLRLAVLCLLVVGCAITTSGCSSPKPVDTVNPNLSPEQRAALLDKKKKDDQ